jgi:hypothetical protein
MQKTFTAVDGRRIRIDSRLPMAEIRWLVNRHHVFDTNAEIAADIIQRSAKSPLVLSRDWRRLEP